jgi:hypothetical protein
MSRKRTIYSAEFKSKLVLEVLKNENLLLVSGLPMRDRLLYHAIH